MSSNPFAPPAAPVRETSLEAQRDPIARATGDRLLAALLHPLGVDRFFAEFWGQRGARLAADGTVEIGRAPREPIASPAGQRSGHAPDEPQRDRGAAIDGGDPAPSGDRAASGSQRFASWFSWDDLNQLLTFHRIPYPEQRLILDGRSLPAGALETWPDYLRRGATLAIDRADLRVPALAERIAALRQALGYRIQGNLYLSPVRHQGFDCHYDTHDVLVLQLAGAKAWSLFRDTQPDPVAETRRDDDLPPEEPPYLECLLKPGDALYVPRGHWHYAVAEPSADGDRAGAPAEHCPSLHLTLGLHPPTGLDYLHWAVDRLASRPRWRQRLPRPNEPDALTRHLDGLAGDLGELLAAPETWQEFLAEDRARSLPPLPANLPERMAADPSVWLAQTDLDFDSRFRPSPYHRPSAEPAVAAPPGDRKPVNREPENSNSTTPEAIDRALASPDLANPDSASPDSASPDPVTPDRPTPDPQYRIRAGHRTAAIAGLSPAAIALLLRPEGASLAELADVCPESDATAMLELLGRLVLEGILQR